MLFTNVVERQVCNNTFARKNSPDYVFDLFNNASNYGSEAASYSFSPDSLCIVSVISDM